MSPNCLKLLELRSQADRSPGTREAVYKTPDKKSSDVAGPPPGKIRLLIVTSPWLKVFLDEAITWNYVGPSDGDNAE
jgi:hypothetical protein